MEDPSLAEKSLLEKIQDVLEWERGHDVAFCVGKEKIIVKGLKIILKAASHVLETEFEKEWELTVVEEGEGIPLLPFPDFDPTAFELFVKLTSLDMWSQEHHLQTLQPTQILNLISICGRFKMKKAAENLEKLATTFMQSFGEYTETEDFLRLSQANLKSVIVRNDIRIKELDVFHSAIRWAVFQCKEIRIQPTDQHIREVLGDCLFEIRFPIMTNTEFTQAIESNDILTAQETIGIYKFIGLAASKKLEFDTKKLPFKTTPRKTTQALGVEAKPNPNTNNGEALIPTGTSTLSLTRDLQIVENPPFVCNGSQNYHSIACEKKITVFGLGFLGPIENDGFYNVKVHIEGRNGNVYDSPLLQKHIFAQKGKKFYFVFDAPIDFEADQISSWKKNYRISYYLKGPNTSAVKGSYWTTSILEEGRTKFRLKRASNQLAEIVFELKDSTAPAAKGQRSSLSLKPPSEENSVTTMLVTAATSSTPTHLICLRNDLTETNAGADTKDNAHSSSDQVTTRSKTKAKATPIPTERSSSRAKKRKVETYCESDCSSDDEVITVIDSKKRPTVAYQPFCQMNPGLEKATFKSDFIPVKAEPDE